MLTKKQEAILTYLKTVSDATLTDIIDNVVEARTFHNSKSYLSQTLARMIKAGLIVRVKRGQYAVRLEN